MAYMEIVEVEEPQRMFCATFFLGKTGNVVPGGYRDTVEEAVHALVHVMETRDVRRWAPSVAALTHGVVDYMEKNPTLSWTRFDVPETPTDRAEEAIAGMAAGTSVRRREEYTGTASDG